MDNTELIKDYYLRTAFAKKKREDKPDDIYKAIELRDRAHEEIKKILHSHRPKPIEVL